MKPNVLRNSVIKDLPQDDIVEAVMNLKTEDFVKLMVYLCNEADENLKERKINEH
jgi:hypothetical protein